MSAEQLAELKEKFVGSWKVYRSEGFEDFLREMGVNDMVSKMASQVNPITEIQLDGSNLTISLNSDLIGGFMNSHDTYKLNEETIIDHLGTKTKTTFTYKDGKIISESKPIDDKIKPTTATREIIGDEMLLTMHNGDVTCRRYFKRVPK